MNIKLKEQPTIVIELTIEEAIKIKESLGIICDTYYEKRCLTSDIYFKAHDFYYVLDDFLNDDLSLEEIYNNDKELEDEE